MSTQVAVGVGSGSGSGAATGATLTRVGSIIASIRDQIPDPAATVDSDGTAFTAAALIRWINDAAKHIAIASGCITDWYAVASQQGMDVYELPADILAVDQLWYDNWPAWRAPELDALFTTKVTSRSYFFGPHAIHAVPRLHVWPAAHRTAATTTLTAAITASSASLPVADASGFRPYGFVKIGCEVILYRTITGTTTITNILRGQGGTVAAAAAAGATVEELNIMFRCSRLPVPVANSADTLEIPVALHPLIELYVLSKVREAEQEHQVARTMMQDFQAATDRLGQRAQLKGLRQGLQVRYEPPGPLLYWGRVYVP